MISCHGIGKIIIEKVVIQVMDKKSVKKYVLIDYDFRKDDAKAWLGSFFSSSYSYFSLKKPVFVDVFVF